MPDAAPTRTSGRTRIVRGEASRGRWSPDEKPCQKHGGTKSVAEPGQPSQPHCRSGTLKRGRGR
jgi:hypothetical protein